MSSREQRIAALVDAIADLSKANRLTGIWDNRRFTECKKDFADIDCAFLYKTERLSRKNVELRAVHRTRIDELFGSLIADARAARTRARGAGNG